MKLLKRAIGKSVHRVAEVTEVEKTTVMTGQLLAHAIAAKPRLKSLAEAEFSVFSQWGEDGIISWLIDRIGTVTDCFVEFGVEDFREANCRYLLVTRNWRGLVIDGSASNIAAIRGSTLAWKYDLQAREAFITRDTIVDLLSSAGFGERLGLLSVDIDGVDYWVLERITTPSDIVVVEYNDALSGYPVSVPYDPEFVRLKKHPSGMYWGASLDAFRHLLEQRNYVFVGTNKAGTNAFFVAGEHGDAVLSSLDEVKSWPCRMREVRNADGSLSLTTYRESIYHILDLPLVDVSTNANLMVRDVVATAPGTSAPL